MSAPSGELRSQQMLDDFLQRRDRALITLDIQWGRWLLQEYHGIPADRVSDQAVLVSLHKARYLCSEISAELRRESAAWLLANGFGQTERGRILPDGELP